MFCFSGPSSTLALFLFILQIFLTFVILNTSQINKNATMRLQINLSLKSLIPPLSEEEYKQLEANCIADGIRDPLVIARYPNEYGEAIEVLADGHNRYEIAIQHGLDFSHVIHEFESLSAVRVWMIRLQLGRRNITDGWKFQLAQTLRDSLLEKGKEKQGERTDLLSLNDKRSDHHNTQAAIADHLGWSKGKTAQAEQVWKKADPEIRQQVLDGDLTIGGAYKEVKKKEQKEIQQQVRESKKAIPLPKGQYDLIYCDPPWRYDFAETENRAIENQYPTMSIEELQALVVPAADNCVLFMWATAPKLKEAFELIEAWGFQYKTQSVWDKQKIGMGYWFRGQHEILMVATKGSVSPPPPNARHSSVHSEPRQGHSEKPEYYYEMIIEMFPDAKRIELFSRKEYQGFDNWGNEQ